MKKFFLFLALLTFGVGQMWGEELITYTLQPASGSNNSYAGNCDVAISSITWNITGNSTQQPWRLGGKSITNTDRAVYSKTAISDNISKIVITHGEASSITINSMTVIVSKNSDFSSPSTLTPTFAASSTVTVNRPAGEDWSNCYYKINYNVTVSGDKNKFLEFTKAEFYKEVSCNPLAAPGSPSSTPHAESVDLSWNSVSGATGYLVTFNGTEYNIASGTTTKTISGLSMETEYHWTVAAKGDGTTNCAVGTATAEQTVTTLDDCTGTKVTYSVTSTSAVSVSGTAPTGATATYSSTYSSKCQLTSGKSMTLTLSGYKGYIIKSIKLSMKSNTGGGSGNFSAVAGTTTISSISTAAFNSASWNGAYTTSYVTIVPTMSNDGYTIKKDEDVVITIAATANSLYCESFSICYEEGCTSLGSINGSFFWSTLFEPLSPDKFRSHVLLCNHLFSSSHHRIPHHLIYTMYISRDFGFF